MEFVETTKRREVTVLVGTFRDVSTSVSGFTDQPIGTVVLLPQANTGTLAHEMMHALGLSEEVPPIPNDCGWLCQKWLEFTHQLSSAKYHRLLNPELNELREGSEWTPAIRETMRETGDSIKCVDLPCKRLYPSVQGDVVPNR